MTITTLSNSPRTTHLLNLADTAFNVLVDEGPKTIRVVESISISCGDTDTDVTIVVTKDGTDYYLFNTVKITAKSAPTYVIGHHIRLNATMKIRAKASVANKISIMAITLDAPPVQGGMAGMGGSVAGGY